MATYTPEPAAGLPDRPGGYTLVLAVLPDPQADAHGYSRDVDNRLNLLLKRLLRNHGFKCLCVRPYPPPGTTTTT